MFILTPRFVLSIFSTGLMVLCAGAVSAQDYPHKPIRIITGSFSGGSGVAARIIGEGLAGPLGQSVVIENRGSGFTAQEVAAKALPDGYTITVSGSSLWLAPLTQKTPYAVTDFTAVALVATTPQVLYVHPSLPVKSVKDLIDLAKSKPGELNYSMGGIGGSSHLAGELFKAMTGINIVQISYSNNSQELADLLSGRVHMTFTTPTALMEQVKTGKLKALAVTSTQPSALVPGVPTVAATGLPGFESGQSIAMLAPDKTPAAIIKRLNQETVRVINQPDVRKRLLSIQLEAAGGSPEELAAKIKTDMERWSKVIKIAGIPVEK